MVHETLEVKRIVEGRVAEVEDWEGSPNVRPSLAQNARLNS